MSMSMFELDNGVMTTPTRLSFLSFIFTLLCISKPLLIRNAVQYVAFIAAALVDKTKENLFTKFA